MIRLNLIGAGRVGQTLGKLLAGGAAVQLQDLLNRSQRSAQAALQFIGAGCAVEDMAALRPADIWLLAVPDSQIAPVAAQLASSVPALPPALAFHCSGALAASELKPLQDQGWQTASAHCLLSFAHPQTALAQFPGTPVALEGDTAACAQLRRLFEPLGARCFDLASADKLLYHAAAVFATNFLPVLQDLAEQLWHHSHMPTELAQAMRERLLRNAVDNIVQLGPQAALTGPAARGDHALVGKQGQQVAQWDTCAGAAYTALSELATRLAAR